MACPQHFLQMSELDNLRRQMERLQKDLEDLRKKVESKCDHCGAKAAWNKCGRCRHAKYCNAACQHAAWRAHRRECRGRAEAPDAPGTPRAGA